MSQYGEELNMQILQPLDLDSTAGILQLNGYLVPLSEWSKAREGYKSNTDRRAFVIILCALIGLAVACMEIWATSSCPIRLPTYIHVLVFLMSFGCSRVVLFPSSRMEKIIRPKPDSPAECWSPNSTSMWSDWKTLHCSTRPVTGKYCSRPTKRISVPQPCLFGRSEAVSKKKVFGL